MEINYFTQKHAMCLPQITDPDFIGNLKLRVDVNICPKTNLRFILTWFFEKLFTTDIFIFEKKCFFLL